MIGQKPGWQEIKDRGNKEIEGSSCLKIKLLKNKIEAVIGSKC
jgi:hypothetical protein